MTVPVASGAQTVGTHVFVWDGNLASEGAWTFSVTATDNRSIETTAERTFTLDDTLGSLAVGADGRGNPTTSFVLSRQADVVVRIERRNGVAVATSHQPHLAAGAHRVTWNGKLVRRLAPPGAYQMRVVATSAIGTSSLVAPFTLK